MTVGVLDYDAGNVGSILSMLRKLAIRGSRIDEPGQLDGCSSFILPGIGAFDDVVMRFRASGLEGPLRDLVLGEERPLLGICVGMQMLARGSEEGKEPGLGWISGAVRHLRTVVAPSLRLPVQGWHYVAAVNDSSMLRSEDGQRQRFYFTHSYYFDCDDQADVAGVADYGAPVTVAIERPPIWATQFHPEKSHHFGMALMRRFAQLAES